MTHLKSWIRIWLTRQPQRTLGLYLIQLIGTHRFAENDFLATYIIFHLQRKLYLMWFFAIKQQIPAAVFRCRYYIQECLGPDVPVIFLVETHTNIRMAVLNAGTVLRNRVNALSAPQIRTIQVEIEYGYKAQVRLFLPTILREYEDVTFPLILIVWVFKVEKC